MKIISAVLLSGAFFFNFSYRWMAEGTTYSPFAMWYMQQGMWVMTLCAALLYFIIQQPRSLARDAAKFGAIIGMVEGFNSCFFRMLISDPTKIPTGQALSDYVTGLPVQATLASLYLLMVCYLLGRWLKPSFRRGSKC